MIDELLEKLTKQAPKVKSQTKAAALLQTRHMSWVPNPGPQTQAYLCKADILLYGGQAGGGKSQLLLGLGSQEHIRAIIFRRESSQTDGLEADGKAIIQQSMLRADLEDSAKVLIGSAAGFNGSDKEWSWPDGRSLKLAGMKDAGDWNKHGGRERDFIGYDEAGEFLEEQVVSLLGWLRGPTHQRARMVLASNPPRTSDGLWLINWFAPWLDDTYPNPAVPGELRWAIIVGDKTMWVDGPEPVVLPGFREAIIPKSRTFIPAALADNPYRNTPEYISNLQALHEPLRSQLLYGDFKAGLQDAANQVIPTSWVRAAMQRWRDTPRPVAVPMCAMGVDASGGGDDPMVLAPRYDGWFAEMVIIPGKDIPQDRAGTFAAGLVIANRRDRAGVVVDMGGGYGGPMYEHLKANDVECLGHKGAEASGARTKDSLLRFFNKRSEVIWRFREALDPDQDGGSQIYLPHDNELLGDLTAPRLDLHFNGIKVESKEDVCKRLGRSTNKGDAVVMAWSYGPKHVTHGEAWRAAAGRAGRTPLVLVGRHHSAAYRR